MADLQGRELDSSEERRMLELDEAIEAVDAAIEYKNEMICSRHHQVSISVSCYLNSIIKLDHKL